MIAFNTVNDFDLDTVSHFQNWLSSIVTLEDMTLGEVNYIFCDDQYLHKLNVDFLDHDTLTDVISFDYTVDAIVSGDIYISTERVVENAHEYNVSFIDELCRVMAHGLLHYCGYKDKSPSDIKRMREKEDYYLSIR